MNICDPKYNEGDYTKFLQKLLPQGPAFPRITYNAMYALLSAFAVELLRIDTQISDLNCESTPEGADLLIGDWEKDAGFPDQCFNIPATLTDRRAQVRARLIFPGGLATGWTGTGNVTAGSNVITGIADTSGIQVGDAVAPSAGYKGNGRYLVTDKTASTITLEQNATHTAAGASLTAYFNTAEVSERFFTAVITWLGYTLVGFEYYDAFLIGPEKQAADITGDITITSPTITNVSTVSNILVGDYLSIDTGFTGSNIKEVKVLSKTESPNTITVDRNATANSTGETIRIFRGQPFGMGDGLGDVYRYAVKIKFSLGSPPADNDTLIKCVLGRLKQSHITFLYQTI